MVPPAIKKDSIYFNELNRNRITIWAATARNKYKLTTAIASKGGIIRSSPLQARTISRCEPESSFQLGVFVSFKASV